MSTHCNPKVVTNNLILYLDAANQKSYPMNDSTYWYDMTKTNNRFSMIGNLTLDDESFLFPGNISNYFISADNLTHELSKLTIEMWVLPNFDSGETSLYSFISTDATITHHYISNPSNLTIAGPFAPVSIDKSILDNKWKQVVRTSSRNTGEEQIYVDGIKVFDEILSPTINFTQIGNILLGQRPSNSGVLNPLFSYYGKIAVFKLYNTVLSDNDVKQNFNALKGRFHF